MIWGQKNIQYLCFILYDRTKPTRLMKYVATIVEKCSVEMETNVRFLCRFFSHVSKWWVYDNSLDICEILMNICNETWIVWEGVIRIDMCDLCVCVCDMYVCTVSDCGSDCVRKITIHRQLLIVPDLLIICYWMFSVVFQYVNLHSLTIQSIEFHIHTVVFWPPWSLCQLCLNKPLILIFSSKISRLYKNTSHKDLVLLGVNSGDQGYQKIPKKLLKTVCLNKDRPTCLQLQGWCCLT